MATATNQVLRRVNNGLRVNNGKFNIDIYMSRQVKKVVLSDTKAASTSSSCPVSQSARTSTTAISSSRHGIERQVSNTESISGKSIKSMHELNGPPALPVVGNFLTYLKKENKGRMHEVQAQLHRTYGPIFKEKWGSNWQVHISDPDLIEEVYRKDGRYPNRPAVQAWVLHRDTYGRSQGLVTAQNEEWHSYRAEFSKRMLCPKASRRLVRPINEVSNDLIARLRHVRDTEGEEKLVKTLSNEMYKWSLEAAGAFLFETRLGCLEVDIPPRTQEFIDAIQQMMSSTLYLIVGEKLHKKLNTSFWKKHKQAWDKIFEISKELIDRRLAALKEQGSSVDIEDTKEGVYLTYILRAQNLNMNQLCSNIADILLGGSDTTANSCCFMLHLLANNRGALERLEDEISTVLGGREEITNDDLEELKYLKCVVKESLRLYPIVTMNCRILEEDIVLDGCLVPKKTLFVLNHYASGRSEQWFSNPDQFIPERWMREGPDSRKNHPFACLPFGFGARGCIGRRVGRMELMIAIAKIIQNFDVRVYEGTELKPTLRTLLTPGPHVPVRFVERGEAPLVARIH